MLQISQLKLIQALLTQGNVSLAANALFISQSALSHRIKKLEDLLGQKIFVRHSEPIALTPVGKALGNLATEMLGKIEGFEKRFISSQFSRLNIAIECHACFDWLMPTLKSFSQTHPQINYDLSMAFSFEPFKALKHYKVDMVVSSDPIDDSNYEYYHLFDYQVLMLVAKQNHLSHKSYLTPTDIATQTLLTYPVSTNRLDVFNYFLNPQQLRPKYIRQVELPMMMLQLVQNNQGIATMPEWAFTNTQTNGITAKPLGKSGMWRKLYLAIRSSDVKIKYLQDFIKLAKQISLQTINK